MITKKWFTVIIFLSYLLIGIIAAFLLYIKFQTSVIMSFLEITVPPSVPAFLAIFLSQFSSQAEDTKKGERLKDIQIKKEISKALHYHYLISSNSVYNGLSELVSYISRIENNTSSIVKQLTHIDANFTKLKEKRSVEIALLHFEGESKIHFQNYLDKFKENENQVVEENNMFNKLKDEIVEFLEAKSQNGKIKVVCEFQNVKKFQNEIYRHEVFSALYKIWNDDSALEKVIKDLKNINENSTNSQNKNTFEKFQVFDEKIDFDGSLTIARTDSFLSGLKILKLLLHVLENSDLRSHCEKLSSLRKEILESRGDFTKKCNDIESKITDNQLLSVENCCPFHEYKSDIKSYFEKSGLYED